MPNYTTNLNLLKKDPETEGNDYFNIQTMLNDNWDKIDAEVAAKETPAGAQAKVDNLAGAGRTTQTVKGNADAIAALNQTVTSHSADNTAHGATSAATASKIIARDANGRAKVAAPSAADDIARKDTVDAVQTNLTNHLADYVRQPGYGTTTGSANMYALTLNPALAAYAAGVAVCVQINVANTGASTLNVNGLGAKSILDSKGNAMTSGKLRLNGIYTLRYDGTNFILQGEGGSGNAVASDLLSGKTASTDAGDITGTMPNKVGSATVITPGAAEQVIPQGYYGGVVGDGKVSALQVLAGDLLLVNDAFRSQDLNTTYQKQKEIQVNWGGTVRVSFNLYRINGAAAYGRIYKNGVAVGIERSTNSDTSIIYTEDFSVNPGDKIQLYCRQFSGQYYWQNDYLKISISDAASVPAVILL